MSRHLTIMPILLPLATAVVLLLVLRRNVRAQRAVSFVSLLVLIGIEVALCCRLFDGEIAVYQLGGWDAPFGIVLMADRLSGVMLLLASVTAVATMWFGFWDVGARREEYHFYPLFQFILMGINGAFLTGDIFNLFVWYEVALISTYSLLTLGSEARQLRAGVPFIVMNLLASTLFLVAVGLLYGVTGTLNMADLGEKVAALQGTGRTVAQSVAMLLLFVFGLKAAIFPLYFWLPDGYPAATATVSAFLGGVATKVGVYSMMRVFPLVFSSQQQIVGETLMGLGAATMLLGVLGAVCQLEIRRLLSFHIISQIGYLIFGLGLFTQAGIAAAVFYMAHYTIVKCALFLVAGIVERITGENNLKKMGGLMESFPALSALFFVAGLSLAGLPPWSGFFAKFVVVKAGFEAGRYFYAGVAVVTGFFTLYSMMKIWQMVFWSNKSGEHRAQPRLIYAGAALLVSFSVIFAVGFSPMNRFAQDTATQLLDAPAYRRAVLDARSPHNNHSVDAICPERCSCASAKRRFNSTQSALRRSAATPDLAQRSAMKGGD
jgi:multicomponent Na+:H+ antiporter subunit D